MSKLYGMSIISQKNIADENFKLKSSIVKIFVNILHLIYAFILNNCQLFQAQERNKTFIP